MDNQNLSGVPPAVTLSGLGAGPGGAGNLSGTNAQGIGGTGGTGGFLPGMEGGMDLATLMQMLQGGDATAGLGVGGSINAGVGAGSFGSGGGLGAGSFGQTQPGYVAGMSSMGGQTQGQQAAAGAIDPASIIQKFLGVAQQGAKAFGGGTGTASPTTGSGATGAEQEAFTTGTASPVNVGQDLSQSGLFQGGIGGTSSFADPTLEFLFTSGALNGLDSSQMSQLSSLPPDQLAGLKTALMSGETQSDLGSQLLSGQGGSGFTLGTGGLDTSLAPSGQSADYLGGGLGLLSGLMGLYQGSQSGNAGSLLGGAGSTLAGANQLMPGMGFGGEALGMVGAGANAPFAALSLANAVEKGDAAGIAQGLASLYGTTVPLINSIFGTTLPTLTSIAGSVLSGLGSAIGGTVGSGLGSAGAALGGTAASTVAPIAASVGGEVGGELAASTAAGAGAALPLGMIMGPYVVAKLIQAAQAMGPDKANARQLGIRMEDIYGQLPGELQTLQGIPGIAGQLSADSTPEQTADILKQMNAMQDQYQAGGWESHQKTGETQVQSVGEGTMGADVSGVQSALDRMNPYMQMMDLTRLRAQDSLSRAGWTPEQIQAQTGRYISPQEWAMNLNSQTPRTSYPGFNPTFNAAIRPENMRVGMNEGAFEYGPSLQQLGYTQNKFGISPTALLQQVEGIAPGNLEQGLMQLLSGYGGVNPGMMQMGFGQGLRPGMQRGAVSPQIMAAANSPRASTSGVAQGAQQGKLQEETLMDLLRRMSPGAAYQGV